MEEMARAKIRYVKVVSDRTGHDKKPWTKHEWE